MLCGIIENTLVGPYLFADNLNGENYLQFLEHNCEDLLNNSPLNIGRDVEYSQHAWAPLHNHRLVCSYLAIYPPLPTDKKS